MIVNPQFFNYRLIIGCLFVAIIFLSVFSVNNYESNKADQQFLKQENKLIESELSQMLLRYDTLSRDSRIISKQLYSAKKNTISALENLSLLASDLSVISRFKSELTTIKSKHSKLFSTVDSINALNQNLERDKLLAYNALDEQQRINNSLLKINANLNSTIERAALLTANSYNAKAYKSSSNTSETSRAFQTQRIEVCFTLTENALATKGKKDIYIQILNPLNNVIAQKGAAEFGEFLLAYSDKQLINYNKKDIDVCSTIQAPKHDKSFAKGTYYVSVFHQDRKLGGTQIVLN